MTGTGLVASSRERLRTSGIPTLVKHARDGLFGLPDVLLDAYQAFETLNNAHSDDPEHATILDAINHAGRDTRHTRDTALDQLADNALRALGCKAPRIITEHLQPVVAEALNDFHTDVAAAGHWACTVQPSVSLLTEPEPVRLAVVRVHAFPPRWAVLRNAWEILRRRDHPTTDPQGLRSGLAEVANLPDVIPDWYSQHRGYRPETGAWPGTSPHARLAWLVSNGAHLWTPTSAEQNAAWDKYRATAIPGPRKIVGSISHSAA